MTSEIRTNSLKSRAGLSTVTMTDSGPMFSGITTFVDNSGFTFGVGGGTSIFTPATNVLTFGTNNTEKIRIDASGHMHGVGVITATHFYGDGSNLTGISGVTINGNVDNRLVTATGTTGTLNGEANLTFDGTNLDLGDAKKIRIGDSQDLELFHNGANSGIINSKGALYITNDATNSSDVHIRGKSSIKLHCPADGDVRIFINSSGDIGFNDTSPTAHASGNNTVLSIKGKGSSYSGKIDFKDSSGNLDNYINSDNSVLALNCDPNSQNGNTSMQFFVHGGERLRIKSNGNIGIGNDASFPVYTHINSRNFMLGTGGESTAIQIHSSSTTYGGIYFGDVADRTDSNSYIGGVEYKHGDDFMNLRVNGANRVKIDSTGRITQNGTTSADTASALTLKNGNSSSDHTILELISDPGQYSMIYFGASDDRYRGQIRYKDNDHFMAFHTSNAERLVINSEGMAQFKGKAGSYYGTASTNNHHQFNNTGSGHWICQMRQEHHNGLGLNLRMNSTGNGEAFQVYYYGSGASTRFRVLNNGNVGSASNSYGGISDIKLKENIVDANSQWDDIKAIKVRNFNFKDTPDTKMLGVVAQEIETISPGLISEIVDKDPDTNESLGTTTKEVKYSILYMKAIKCLQEAQARIEKIEEDNITLRARVTNLEGN